jgi:iron complex transport system ATP-binding protein
VSLAARQLRLQVNSRRLVDALDLTLEPGEVLGILGANGAGKSTLLSVLAGLATPSVGEVTLDGQSLGGLPPLTRAQHIGLLPQGDEAGFFGSVADFVALGRHPFGRDRFDLAPLLDAWELGAFAQRPLHSLSGGERQRARLAQLAAQASRVTLLDEPLTHLDPAHQARLLGWVRAEADAGHSVALTLHDPTWAACHCDRLLFLYGDGRWRIGTTTDLLTPASLEGLYGPATSLLWRHNG